MTASKPPPVPLTISSYVTIGLHSCQLLGLLLAAARHVLPDIAVPLRHAGRTGVPDAAVSALAWDRPPPERDAVAHRARPRLPVAGPLDRVVRLGRALGVAVV